MRSPLLEKWPRPAVEYPDSNGEPMAENTLQFEWIVTVKENLAAIFGERDDVFVAGDLLWYPVEGHPEIRCAPDALVAFGRPKGYRGSYMQWVEGNVPPQVVFEILSPGNREAEMTRKFQFYERYGVEEYYLYDPDGNELSGWTRVGEKLEPVASLNDWTSPRLGIRFELGSDTLRLYRPDGDRFRTFAEQEQQFRKAIEENRELEAQSRKAQEEKEAALRQVQEQADEIAQLRQRLKALGEAGGE